jgi:hypothetical protein
LAYLLLCLAVWSILSDPVSCRSHLPFLADIPYTTCSMLSTPSLLPCFNLTHPWGRNQFRFYL